MSLFGSMTTAISGLAAQSHALSNISGNVANSQTTGFKRLDTSFEDMVAQSARHDFVSGGVKADNQATNNIQGSMEQVESPLSLALSGRGFFSVTRPVSRTAEGVVSFDARDAYSRAGDFTMDRDGYLINGSGYALRGWQADASGELNRSALSEIRVDRGLQPGQPTGEVQVSANLPTQPTAGATMSTTMQVHDALGQQRPLTLGWTQATAGGVPVPNSWDLNVTWTDGATNAPVSQTFGVVFNGASTLPGAPPAGTLQSITLAGGAAAPGAAGAPAALTINPNFGPGAQPVNLSFGTFGGTGALTQFAGTEYTLRSVSQDGAAAGAFASVAVRDNGDVVANYDNGQSRVVARVPVVTFADPDALDRLDGSAFGATSEAGPAVVADAGRGGAADINVGAVERSNVDIASEFSKLIVAQRAYTANTRIVTTVDEMLQESLNMRR
jgi:flagellar hook protein FlgE